jgi:signal transduction histidine kinase
MSLARAVLAGVAGLAMLLTHAVAEETGNTATPITAQATLVPDGGKPLTTQVTLPHGWDKAYPGQGGHATYRLELPERAAGADHALYFARVGNQVEVWLGQQNLVPLEVPRDPNRDRAKAPLLVPIAANNTARDLTVQVWTQAGRWGGLASVAVGPREEMEQLYQDRYVSRQYGALVVSVGMLLASLVAASLWWVQREPVHGVFAWASFCGALRFVDRLIETPPLPWPLWGALNALALAWFILGMCRFCTLLARPGLTWTYAATNGLLVLEAVLVGVSFYLHLPWVWDWGLKLLALPAFATLGLVLYTARQQQSGQLYTVGAAIGVTVAAGCRDLWVVRLQASGIDHFSVLPHASLLFVLMLGWLVVDRYARNARAHRDLLETLETKIRARETELAASNAQLREEHDRQATLMERQRIMRDIHDGVGAQLVGLLSLLNRGGAARETLQEQAEAALDELRMAVDALQPVHGDLTTVLATLRYRLQPRLQAAGIGVNWQVQALPPIDGLTPGMVLQLQRILLEAFTNVIRHARATRLTVDTHTAQNPDRLVLQVIDNGQGMDLDTPREGGQGLANMRARAVAVGANLAIRSTPGEGTCVQVELPMRVGSPAAD